MDWPLHDHASCYIEWERAGACKSGAALNGISLLATSIVCVFWGSKEGNGIVRY